MKGTVRTNDPAETAGDALTGLGSREPDARIPGRNVTKADILVYRLPGGDLAVKDYSARPWVVRNTLGRMLLRREAAAYRAAGALDGLPRCLGRVGTFALALERVAGDPLARCDPRRVSGTTFERLERIVRDLHGRGVALADLHHRDVLVGADGAVHVVDLATAVVLGPRPGRLRRALFARARDADLVAVARMRARWSGGDLDAAVTAAAGPRAAAWHRRGRRLKRLLARLRG